MGEPVGTGMCYCGMDVDAHSVYTDNHNPVEVIFEEDSDGV